ncbi:hypothetical protein [Frigidibacter sp. ROC022]|uniref:hypothetical protein n=1 Tax=Frigidibacter sp. ROC022 TaxID=2971796 RepID=UPI00215A8CD3|nr:hypothetical protein [Frigidibacter sp. ROC022]MCR8725643.1 hypothetical protein [Frigidibacter sp. ROC022]
MTRKDSGKAPEEPSPEAAPQMGSQPDGEQKQAQQSGDAQPAKPGRGAPRPVRFTDWASI